MYTRYDKQINDLEALISDLTSAQSVIATTYSRGQHHPACIALQKVIERHVATLSRLADKASGVADSLV